MFKIYPFWGVVVAALHFVNLIYAGIVSKACADNAGKVCV